MKNGTVRTTYLLRKTFLANAFKLGWKVGFRFRTLCLGTLEIENERKYNERK